MEISSSSQILEDKVMGVLRPLSEAERQVLTLLNGLEDGQLRTPSQVADQLSLPLDQVEELQRAAMQKLQGGREH